MQQEKKPSKPPEVAMLIKLMNMGSIIFFLALVGIWLDRKFNSLPLYTLIGIFLGVCYSFYEAWRIYNNK